jgi:hypothetical protein
MAARRTAGAVLIVSAALAAGCDRAPAPQTNPSQPPSTMPATNPTTGPSTTQAAAPTTFLTIDDTIVEFPTARVRLDKTDEGFVGLLFSDDPPAALEEGYVGNSFYLQMPLDIADAKELSGAQWIHRSTTSDREDTPFGIFMEGRRWQLQPDDARADFHGDGSSLEVSLNGTFLLFDNENPKHPARRVRVSGTFPAPVQARVRKP